MYPLIILIRFSEDIFMQQELAKPILRAEFVIHVHLNRFERANLDADLAAHANRYVDIEHLRLELQLPDVIRLLGSVLDYVNALGWAFFLTDLTRHTPQAFLPIIT